MIDIECEAKLKRTMRAGDSARDCILNAVGKQTEVANQSNDVDRDAGQN